MKRCSSCGETKPLEDFSPWKRSKDGRYVYCHRCSAKKMNDYLHAHRDEVNARRRRRRQETLPQARLRNRAENLKHHYGITPEDYEVMLAAQGFGCAICGTSEEEGGQRGRLAIDHDHETGVIRGLLCGPCNAGLGAFGDDPHRMEIAIEYVRVHEQKAEQG